MNPAQNWLQNLWLQSLSQNGTTSPAQQATQNYAAGWQALWQTQCQQQWNNTLQQWQKAAESAWQSPSSFWQAVAGIQSARARSFAQFWQQQPLYMMQLFQCTSFPQWIETVSRYNNALFSNMVALGTITQAQRGNLMQQWQRQFSTATPQTWASLWQQSLQSCTSAANATTSPQEAATSSATRAPSTTGTSATSSSTATAASTGTSTYTKVQTTPVSSTAHQSTLFSGDDTSSKSASSQSPTSQSTSSSSNGLSSNVTPIVSSTADSVMRSSSGSGIGAAAAAARRSVVARRMSSQRRRAPR